MDKVTFFQKCKMQQHQQVVRVHFLGGKTGSSGGYMLTQVAILACQLIMFKKIMFLLPYALAKLHLSPYHKIMLPLYSISKIKVLTLTMDVLINLFHINLFNTMFQEITCFNIILSLVFAMRF